MVVATCAVVVPSDSAGFVGACDDSEGVTEDVDAGAAEGASVVVEMASVVWSGSVVVVTSVMVVASDSGSSSSKMHAPFRHAPFLFRQSVPSSTRPLRK